MAVISGRRSRAAAARLEELGLAHVHLGREDKLVVLSGLLRDLGLEPAEVACAGDDVTDLEIMQLAGLGIAVADAQPAARAAAAWCTAVATARCARSATC